MNGEEGRSTRGLRSLSSFFSRRSLSSLVGSVDKGEVRYFYPRDPQGRFSHGEGGDPEVKRRKIDAAVREAHRRILDNPNETARAAYDAAADQGLSGHDAQDVFQLVDQKMRKEAEALAKDGTSDGAKLGWETRRHGSADVAPDVPQAIAGGNAEHFHALRAGVEEMIAQEVEDLNRETENHRKRIPSDYAGMTRRLEERGRQGFAALQDVRARLNSLQPSREEDKVLLGKMLGYVEAKIVGSRHGEFDVGERFRSLLSDAANLSGKLEREASMARKSIREILDDARSEALAKEGTSDGAVRGWETRRSGAAPVEETPKKGQDYLKQMGRRLSTAQDVSGRMKRILDSGKKITDVMDKKEIEVYSDSLRGALADAENVFTRVKNPSDTVYENLGYAKGSFNEADKKPPEERAAMLSELWRPVYNLYRQGMELAEQGWDEKKNKSITKEGTSEGAKKGWETRRGAAPEDESELHRRNAPGYLASAKAIEQKLKGLGHTFSHRIFSSYSGIGADEANKLRAELEMNRTAHRAATQGKAVTREELREAVAAVSPEVAAAYERHFGSKKEKAKEDLRIVVRPPIPSKRGANRNVMSPTGEN